MFELHRLQKAREDFLLLNQYSAKESLFRLNLADFLAAVRCVFEAICDEAFQTPAGKRWFSGQLTIHATANFFYLTLFDDKNPGNFLKPGSGDILQQCQRCIDELDRIIKSGLNRYISG